MPPVVTHRSREGGNTCSVRRARYRFKPLMVIALLIGLLVGVTATFLALRPRMVAARRLEVERPLFAEQLRAVEDAGRTFERRAIEAEARLDAEQASLGERVAAVVREASAAALQQNSTSFLGLAETKLDNYVKPLRESLGKVETQVTALENARREAYGALTEGVRQLRADQERLRTETGNLVSALRAPHVRGRWGEIQLRRVIEMAGMLPYCDFEEQHTLTDTDGRTLRPDVVVKLPGDKAVIIDSKAPIVAYLDAFREGIDDDTRRAYLADHARHVRDHVQKLGQKAYWRQLPATPEFVIMFLPDETFLRAAVEHDPSLTELAIANNVIPASPMNLIGLLRAVHYGWQQERIAESAREMSELGRELYRRLSTMGTHFTKLGRALDGTVKTYNETVGSLERNVLPQARKFERHGISGIGPPELTAIERVARTITAPELCIDDLPSLELEVLAGDAA